MSKDEIIPAPAAILDATLPTLRTERPPEAVVFDGYGGQKHRSLDATREPVDDVIVECAEDVRTEQRYLHLSWLEDVPASDKTPAHKSLHQDRIAWWSGWDNPRILRTLAAWATARARAIEE